MDKKNFYKGIKGGIPIALGYLSVAFAFGITTVNSGLSVWDALFISMTNVTSAGQLAGVPIIVAGGTLIEMAVAQFIINLRYALMSISLSQKFDKSMTLIHRIIIAFVNTDEVFAVASSQNGTVGRSFMYGLILTPYIGWSAGTLAGAVCGDILPPIVTSSLGIAIYGMFVAIVVPVAKEKRSVALCAALAVAVGCIFKYLPFLSSVPSGFVIIISASVAAAVFAFVAPIKPEYEEDKA